MKSIKRLTIGLLFMLCLNTDIFAQKLSFEHLFEEDGLPHNNITNIFQDYKKNLADCKNLADDGNLANMGNPQGFSSNLIVLQRKIYDPKEILERLNKYLQKAIKHGNSQTDDGMDICLCRIEKYETKYNIIYAGAKRPLLYYTLSDKQLHRIKGTIKGIGGFYTNIEDLTFENTEVELSEGDTLYLTTDGYTDQANNQRKAFSTQQFQSLLTQIALLPMNEQCTILETKLAEHQGDAKQRDDITVMGIRL